MQKDDLKVDVEFEVINVGLARRQSTYIPHTKPIVQQSRLQIVQKKESPKNDSTLNISAVNLNDDANSQNRSTTTQGGGLANKIGLAISRILSCSSKLDETDDDVADLVSLVSELNLHSELTVKLSSTNKISKILSDVKETAAKDVFAEI